MWSRNLHQQRQLPFITNHTLSVVFQGLKNDLTSLLNLLICQNYLVLKIL